MPLRNLNLLLIDQTSDLNRDGLPDLVMTQNMGEVTEGHNAQGKKVTMTAQVVEHRPFLRAEKGRDLYFPFDKQDACGVPGVVGWVYIRPSPFFNSPGGARFFSAGMRVVVDGKAETLEGFRVGVREETGRLVVEGPSALLSGCRAVALDRLAWVTPKGERLDPEKVFQLARCTEKDEPSCKEVKSNSTVAETELATVYTQVRQAFATRTANQEDIENFLFPPSPGTMRFGKRFAGLEKDWRLKAHLIEGAFRYLAL